MINYNKYVYTKKELIRYGLCGGSAGFVLLMLFYNNVVLCGILSLPVTLFSGLLPKDPFGAAALAAHHSV